MRERMNENKMSENLFPVEDYKTELRKELRDLDYGRTKIFLHGKISKEDYIEVGVLIHKLYKLLLGEEV